MFTSYGLNVHSTPLVGLEPTPSKLTAWRSTTEPQRQVTGDLFNISYLHKKKFIVEKKTRFFLTGVKKTTLKKVRK